MRSLGTGTGTDSLNLDRPANVHLSTRLGLADYRRRAIGLGFDQAIALHPYHRVSGCKRTNIGTAGRTFSNCWYFAFKVPNLFFSETIFFPHTFLLRGMDVVGTILATLGILQKYQAS
jgi:hypothetical protein